MFQENNSGGIDYTILKKKIEEKKLLKKAVVDVPSDFTEND